MKAENLLLVERAMRFMPWTVQPSDSVAHARALLDEHRINHLPVLSNRKLVGVVNARDLQPARFSAKRRGIERALKMHPDRVAVASVMTTDVHTATPKDKLSDAAKLMVRKHVGALPVVEEAHLRGIITRSDVIGAWLALGTHTTVKPAKLQDRRTWIRVRYRRAQ